MTLEEMQEEAHSRCGPNHPMGRDHAASVHGAARFYLPLADEGYTAKAIMDAIIAIAGDPAKGEWTSHPRPERVREYLRARSSR